MCGCLAAGASTIRAVGAKAVDEEDVDEPIGDSSQLAGETGIVGMVTAEWLPAITSDLVASATINEINRTSQQSARNHRGGATENESDSEREG